MYLVPDGKIYFINENCDKRDIVDGILMTDNGVETSFIRNDNLGAEHRCNDGRLVIDGLLVSPQVDELFVNSRRAVLDDRFNITLKSQEQKVFEAASVLLKSDPSVWKMLPPGANSFLRSISIRIGDR